MAATEDSGSGQFPQAEAPSAAWLAAIFEAAPDAMLIVAANGAIVMANRQATRLIGQEGQRLIGQPVAAILPAIGPVSPAESGQTGSPAAEGDPAPPTPDPRMIHHDGRYIPIEISICPLPAPFDQDQLWVIRDVSGRQGEDQTSARLAAIVEASSDAIIGTHADGIILSWNPAAARLYGYSAAEAIGRPIDMTLPEDRPREIDEILARIRQGEATERLETVRVGRNGRRFEVDLTVSPVRGRDGRVIGTSAVVRDISARKRAEAALRESEDRFHGAFDAAAIGMALVGLDGRFMQVNRSLCEIVGYSEDELLHSTFQMITHPDDLEDDLSLVQRLLDGVIPNYSLEKRYLHKDGSNVWILLSVTLVHDSAGEPRYFVSQIQDVTRAREAERMKDDFISTVSHELRTPLTSISGYVDLLLDDAGGPLSETTRHFLDIVQQNSQRLINLVNDLLDISRIEAGEIGLRQEPVDLAAQLQAVVSGFAPQIAAKQQSLRLELREPLPAISGDAQRIAQIFTNLISNAHKYSHPGGTITVSARSLGDGVQIDVTDSGVGLSPEEQAQLFSRFFRARHQETRAEGGTGLGLTITRTLIELHGGAISVTSEPGHGSTFSVFLPHGGAERGLMDRGEHGDPLSLLDREEETPGAGCRILVVEDDADVGGLLRELLEGEGYVVTVVGTAEAAVASALASTPDLITLDLKLPDAHGWSVLDQLTAAGIPMPPVVVVSILPENGHGRRLGVVDYLAKPVRGAILRERVARALATIRTGNVSDNEGNAW